jgi:O-antigen/teichoic acid export membrane protein
VLDTERHVRRARVGIALWGANLGVMATGFIAPLALAHLTSPQDYGRFSFVSAVLATCSILTAPGLNIAVTQGAARGQHGTLALAVRSRVRWSAAATLAVTIAGVWVLLARDRETGIILMVCAPLIVTAYGMDLAGAFLNGIGRYRILILQMFAVAGVPAASLAVGLLAGLRIVSATVGYFVALSATNLIFLWWVRRRYVSNGDADPEVIRYGQRLSWISSLGAVQFYFDRLVIGAALGFADLAIYSVAKIFQQGLKSTWTAVNQQLFPMLASRNVAGARELTQRMIVPLWIGFAGLCAIGLVLAPMVVDILFGHVYANSVLPARLLMIAVVAGIPGAQFEIFFRAVADERRLYIQRITFAVCEVVFTGVGAWTHGVLGATIGSLAAYAINSVMAFALCRRT